jgi:very-short-patch-repair endonuclease
LLWNLLRKAPDGVIFRRQHSLTEKITVDFYCAKARLCIEIDASRMIWATTQGMTKPAMHF